VFDKFSNFSEISGACDVYSNKQLFFAGDLELVIQIPDMDLGYF